MTHRASDHHELDSLLDRFLVTRAGPGYDALRGEALAELLEIGEPAHEALLTRLDERTFADPILRALPLWGLARAVPVLRRYLLDGDGPTTVTAAHALAEHPDETARWALLDGLASDRDQTVVSAARGLAERGEASVLGHLRRRAESAEFDPAESIRRAIEQLEAGRGTGEVTA